MFHLPSPPKPLNATDIHCWQLTIPPDCPALSTQWLTPDEKARAERYRFKQDYQQFVLARTGLRFLLGHYLDQPPTKIKLIYNQYGKPYLSTHPLNFNLSHSKQLILYAFCNHYPVGIDIEVAQAAFQDQQLARQILHPAEWQKWLKLPATEQATQLQKVWVLKEAFIKAIGYGLHCEPQTLELPQFLDFSSPFTWLSPLPALDYAHWTIYPDLHPAPFAATLVVGGMQHPQLHHIKLHFSPDFIHPNHE